MTINQGCEKVIVTGSPSKAYSMAVIHIGWIACKNKDLVESCADKRHSSMISIPILHQVVAAEALSENYIHGLLGENIQLAKLNLRLVEDFIERHRWACSWVKPIAGTTCFVKLTKMGELINDEAFCTTLLGKTRVMVVPGSKCFGVGKDFRGCIRIGLCQKMTF